MHEEELRERYRGDYVGSFPAKDRGRLERLLPLMDLGPHMEVVDFGCGNGLLLEAIHDRVSKYYGVDFSSEFIAAARRRQEQLSIRNATFQCEVNSDFCARHPGKFDRAFAMDFSEHVYDKDFVNIAKAIRQCLKPEGLFYLHTPNAEFFLEIAKDKGVMRQFPEHIAVRNAADTVRLLESASFTAIKVVHLPHYLKALSWLHWFSRVPMLGRFFRARLFIECRPQS